ncbi:MAG: hypothetical protein RLW68_00915 [Devosia marina]|uniref:hypothetical protein n=1 Tax=Devosia marina TaxID=2683198 RepID=UPI0032EEE5AF
MPAPKIEWTDAMRDKVREYYLIEGKSAREIAEIMGDGITKNMVLGQLYNMGAMRKGKASNGDSPRLLSSRKAPTYPKRETGPVAHVNEMWGMEEDARRRKFTQKAARGARAALLAIMAGAE